MNNIMDYVKVFDIIPQSDCDDLVNYLDNSSLKWDVHTWNIWNDKNNYYSEDDKELDTSFDSYVSSFTFPYTIQALEKYHNFLSDKNLPEPGITKVTKGRINRYTKDDMMRIHVDHIHDIFDGEDKGIPILSVLLEITGHENYQGGSFNICNKSFKMSKGQYIIFPSIFLYPHGVEPITEGTRYSFISWAY